MIPLAMQQIFTSAKALESQGWSFKMSASMVEVYNEELIDLLAPRVEKGRKHQVGVGGQAGGRVGDPQ